MTFDALVLLGCRVAPVLPPVAQRRVARAARAFRDGLSSRIVVAGGRIWGDLVEAEAFAEGLLREGVPEAALLLERVSLTTRDNARFSERLLRPLAARRVGVVTCDWHLDRALYCFERVGLSAEGVPAASPALPFGRRTLRQLREESAWLLDRAILGR